MSDESQYEKYLDDETAQFMEKIIYAQVVEALTCNINDSVTESMLANSIGDSDYTAKTLLGRLVTKICYEYYRSVFAEKETTSFEGWKQRRAL